LELIDISLKSVEEIRAEIEKQATKRAKTALAFLLLIISNWAVNLIIPIVTGQKPLTSDAIFVSGIVLIVYFLFSVIDKFSDWMDKRRAISWLDLNNEIRRQRLEELRSLQEAEYQKSQNELDLTMRKKFLEDYLVRGVNLFASPPDERNDWDLMASSFIKTVQALDKQLTKRDLERRALIVLEKKVPKMIRDLDNLMEEVNILKENQLDVIQGLANCKIAIEDIMEKINEKETD